MFSEFHFFENLNNIPLYIYIYYTTFCLSIHLLMDIWIVFTISLSCKSHNWGNWSTNICSVSSLSSLGYISKSRLAGLYGNSVQLFEESPMVFHRSCPVLHSYQQCISRIFFHILTNACYFPFFKLITDLVSMKWCLVVLICISLMKDMKFRTLFFEEPADIDCCSHCFSMIQG